MRPYTVYCVFALSLAMGCQNVLPNVEPQWRGNITRIDISNICKSADYSVSIEFSLDSSMICLYNYFPYMSPPKRHVFDLQGREVTNAVDKAGFFTANYISQFPRSIPLVTSNLPSNTHLIENLPSEDIHIIPKEINDRAGSWIISQDHSQALILVKPQSSFRAMTGKEIRELELWKLKPTPVKIWSITSPKALYDWVAADFFDYNDTEYIIVAEGYSGYIIDQKTGCIKNAITFDNNTTREQLREYEKKLIPKTNLDPSVFNILKFDAHKGDVHRGRRLLACGDLNGRRIKVFSLDFPSKPVFEANTYDSPILKGYFWSTERVHFSGDYLIIDYALTQRGGGAYYQTEIYDVRTWKKVWQVNSDKMGNVTLSPDGKRMAILKGDYLEIGSFTPNNGI